MMIDACTSISACPELLIYVTGILGAVVLVYSQFVEAENRRDLIRLVGALALFVYAFYVEDKLFMGVTLGIALACLIEFIEIYLGYHKHHKEDLYHYKHPKK